MSARKSVPLVPSASPPPEGEPGVRCLKICLINPRFNPTFWGYDYANPMYSRDPRCHLMTSAMSALAGMLDRRHEIRIVDENVEQIDFEALADYEVIGVTGMIVQRWRMREILVALQALPAKVVVGGPLVTCDPDFFQQLCDVRFIGEADQTWPLYIEDFAANRATLIRYEQTSRTDMTQVPKPRLDLLKAERYEVACVQFSRGCPFRCEFCDIIVMFGRVPRTKLAQQVIDEFEDVRQAGFKTCFLVDDNFIGNKKQAKRLLREIIRWQQQHDYPLVLSTEASINLADDQELLDLMAQANFTHVFIGIESSNPAALQETLKTQNLRGDSMLDKLRRIRRAGIIVIGGFIVGFDEDTPEIFEQQFQFIQDSGIGLASIGILAPLPTTPLYQRLEKAGRLYPEDPECAFIPQQMSREQLKQGHRDLLIRVYEPQAFFGRIFSTLGESPQFVAQRRQIERSRLNRRPWPNRYRFILVLLRLIKTLIRTGHLKLLQAYWRAWGLNRRLPGGGIPLAGFVNLCVKHWHFYNIAHGRQDSIALESRHDKTLQQAR